MQVTCDTCNEFVSVLNLIEHGKQVNIAHTLDLSVTKLMHLLNSRKQITKYICILCFCLHVNGAKLKETKYWEPNIAVYF